jgi:hypothetical protein
MKSKPDVTANLGGMAASLNLACNYLQFGPVQAELALNRTTACLSLT